MKKKEKAERRGDELTEEQIEAYGRWLEEKEKSKNTVEKYTRDVRGLWRYLKERGQPLTHSAVLAYKSKLVEDGYAAGSINSMLVSLNRFFAFCNREECRVQTLRRQRRAYRAEERELTRKEYERLVRSAEAEGNERLSLILQTLGGTGIRISELKYITAEAAEAGEAIIRLKGKTREILLVKKLKKLLQSYAKRHGVTAGPIFVTRTGTPIDRTNVWREMKQLCKRAGVDARKVFPHNLRHLFARIYYGLKKDLAKLADILGHTSVETTRIYLVTTSAEHLRYLERMQMVLTEEWSKKKAALGRNVT